MFNLKTANSVTPINKNTYYILRLAAAMCFLGHGAFGIITKPIWCNYFAVFGIGKTAAYALMPWVGSMDILMGLSLLFYPTRTVLSWLVVWGLFTAMLRPMSGEPFPELIERAGNFGVPLVLLILCSDGKPFTGKWFTSLKPVEQISAKTLAKITICLRVVVFLLLAGHGWLNLIEKKGIMSQYMALGFSNPAFTAHAVGLFELVAAVIVLVKPIRDILIVLLVWKIATELFYPHWEAFEWIERGGSYGAILALWLTLKPTTIRETNNSLQQTHA